MQAVVKNNVDVENLTAKLINLKVESNTKQAQTFNDDDSENDEENIQSNNTQMANKLNNDTKMQIKTESKINNNTVSKPLINRKQRIRKPLSNLTNNITYEKPSHDAVYNYQQSITDNNNNNNNNEHYQWYNHSNYMKDAHYGQYYGGQSTIQYNQIQTSFANDQIMNNTPCIEKIHLDANLFTNETWLRYSEQLIMAHSPFIVWDAPYTISNVQFSEPFDLILKVWHQRPRDAKKYFTIYLVHKKYATQGKHSSEVLENVIKEKNTSDIDIQVQDICSSTMHHVIIYMYTGHVTVTSKDLIPLFTLVERLKMKGDIKKQLLLNIRKQYKSSNDVLIPYLLQSKNVESHSIMKEIYLQIIKKG
eukprot:440045_1